MAEKKKKADEKKIVLERTYIVPLRKEWLKSPKYRRSKKAVNALQEFVVKHMKAVEVKLGKSINEYIWRHGIKNPPHKVKVICSKDDKGTVAVELFGAKPEKVKVSKKESKKKAVKVEEKTAEVKEEKKESVAKEEKPKEEKKEAVAKEEKPKEEEPKAEVKAEEKKE